MKKDIANRADLELVVTEFYQKLLNDPDIHYFFDHILEKGTLNEHLETIIHFWHDILFLTTKYGKNAMRPHLELHKRIPFAKEHFEIWLNHFNTTIDHYFEGRKATMAKQRALSIATIMEIKLQD